MDPATGNLTVLTRTPDECPLNDVESPRTWTCIAGLGPGGGGAARPTKATIVVHREGQTRKVQIDTPARQVGNAIVDEETQRVAVGIYTGMNAGQSYALQTITIDLESGRQQVSTTDGTVPGTWLPDGSLVVSRADDASLPDRCAIITRDGRRVPLGAGEFVGYLSDSGSVPTRTSILL
ncbi:MAG: hypothetical protein LC750_15400 [Actinobacteria bacterium]|nr:hypothetical protein [Actinomycetota bacterium]